MQSGAETLGRGARWLSYKRLIRLLMRQMRNDKLKRQARSLGRWVRADYNFAVATVALTVFFVIAGFSAWIFGNSGVAVIPPAHHSSIC
jgi:hypothetical protein